MRKSPFQKIFVRILDIFRRPQWNSTTLLLISWGIHASFAAESLQTESNCGKRCGFPLSPPISLITRAELSATWSISKIHTLDGVEQLRWAITVFCRRMSTPRCRLVSHLIVMLSERVANETSIIKQFKLSHKFIHLEWSFWTYIKGLLVCFYRLEAKV